MEVVDEVPVVEPTTPTTRTRPKKVPEVVAADSAAAEVVEVVGVEAEPWVPSTHKRWKDPVTSIISLDQKPGHVLTDSTAPCVTLRTRDLETIGTYL